MARKTAFREHSKPRELKVIQESCNTAVRGTYLRRYHAIDGFCRYWPKGVKRNTSMSGLCGSQVLLPPDGCHLSKRRPFSRG